MSHRREKAAAGRTGPILTRQENELAGRSVGAGTAHVLNGEAVTRQKKTKKRKKWKFCLEVVHSDKLKNGSGNTDGQVLLLETTQNDTVRNTFIAPSALVISKVSFYTPVKNVDLHSWERIVHIRRKTAMLV